jgi:hypothetical protein
MGRISEKSAGLVGENYASRNQEAEWIFAIFGSSIQLCWPSKCGACCIRRILYFIKFSNQNSSPPVQSWMLRRVIGDPMLGVAF